MCHCYTELFLVLAVDQGIEAYGYSVGSARVALDIEEYDALSAVSHGSEASDEKLAKLV